MFFDYMSMQIDLQCYSVCLKCMPLACVHVLSLAGQCRSMDMSMTCCSVRCQRLSFCNISSWC